MGKENGGKYLQPEVTNLSDEEKNQLLALLKKVGYRKSGKEIFEAFWPIFPMAPIEAAVLREIGGKLHILLWYRDDEHYKGWHVPGKYILFGEKYLEAVERVLEDETGMKLRSARFLRHFNLRPSTGWVPNHQLNMLYIAGAEGEPFQGEFFPLDAIPDDTLPYHKYYVECVRGYFMWEEVARKGKIKHIHDDAAAPEWKWRVNTAGGFDGQASAIFDTLDEALADLEAKRSQGVEAWLVDDQGFQIL